MPDALRPLLPRGLDGSSHHRLAISCLVSHDQRTVTIYPLKSLRPGMGIDLVADAARRYLPEEDADFFD